MSSLTLEPEESLEDKAPSKLCWSLRLSVVQARATLSTYIPGEDELLHKKSQKLLIYLCLIVQQVVKEHVDNVGAGPLMSGKHTHRDVEKSFKTCH